MGKDGTRQIVLNAPVLEIVVDMVVVWMVFVNVKTNGLDLTVQSNQHQNVKKTCLATCQKNSAEGDDGADARQRCLKDCIKKNCHAQKFNIRRVPPMESMVDRIYA